MDKNRLSELAARLAVRSADMHAERGTVPRSALLGQAGPDNGVPDFPALDGSKRARSVRMIMKIADTHGWRMAITHFLDTKGVSYLSDLTDPQLEDLLDRMHGYVDAASVGASLTDCFPAY